MNGAGGVNQGITVFESCRDACLRLPFTACEGFDWVVTAPFGCFFFTNNPTNLNNAPGVTHYTRVACGEFLRHSLNWQQCTLVHLRHACLWLNTELFLHRCDSGCLRRELHGHAEPGFFRWHGASNRREFNFCQHSVNTPNCFSTAAHAHLYLCDTLGEINIHFTSNLLRQKNMIRQSHQMKPERMFNWVGQRKLLLSLRTF